MKNPTLLKEEMITLQEVCKHHPCYSVRQRASIIMSYKKGKQFKRALKSFTVFTPLIKRYNQFGFLCLLNQWATPNEYLQTN